MKILRKLIVLILITITFASCIVVAPGRPWGPWGWWGGPRGHYHHYHHYYGHHYR